MNVATPNIVACVIPQTWDEYGSDGDRVFYGTAQQTAFLFPESLLNIFPVKMMEKILVGRADVEETSRRRRCHRIKQKYGSDAAAASPRRGTKDQPNRYYC